MKRLTDSEKWADPWFRTLTPSGKLFWLFLLDNCDNAGIWKRDDDLFKFFSGIDVEVDAHIEELGERVVLLACGKILVPKFIQFQQGGNLTPEKAPHRQIIKILDRFGLGQDDQGNVFANGNQSKGNPKPSDSEGVGLAKPTGLETDYRISLENKKTRAQDRVPPELDTPEFHAAWKSYLRMRSQQGMGILKGETCQARWKKWAEFGVDLTVAALKQSVLQAWRGVFPEQLEQKTKATDDDRDYDHALDF